MLKLYHGSNVPINKIDLSKGLVNKDFGQGFYLTSIQSQAEAMAERKANQIVGASPIVTTFLFDDSVLESNNFNVKVFDKVSEEWAEFIYNNRKSSVTGFKHNYDIVIGPVANDGVVVQLNLFEQQFITLSELVNRLKYRDLSNQYYFGTEKSLSALQLI